MKSEHSVKILCEVMGVSRSGYYRSLDAKPTRRAAEDATLTVKIAETHRQSRGNYGAPRIEADLRARGVRTSRKRCARLMKSQGLQGRKRHRRRPRTTDSNHDKPVAPNVLKIVQAPSAPGQVWVTDITCVATAEGWLYVAAILDLFSRRVVGWACAPFMAALLVSAAWRDAVARRRPRPGLLHHSDRGSQYVDHGYVTELEALGVARSMSRKGNCYDNAAMESFWSTLKTETGLETLRPATRREAELAIFDYIETFYNPVRRHSSLDYLSPVAFEKLNQKNDINVA
jgi:transposase InsO family protein